MKEILTNEDIARVQFIEKIIQNKDIRTHSQLKQECKKLGIKVDIQKDNKGNLKSYSITSGKGKKELVLDSSLGKDRNFMKKFDEKIESNRQIAILKSEPTKGKEETRINRREKEKNQYER